MQAPTTKSVKLNTSTIVFERTCASLLSTSAAEAVAVGARTVIVGAQHFRQFHSMLVSCHCSFALLQRAKLCLLSISGSFVENPK